jgi:glutaredoxin
VEKLTPTACDNRKEEIMAKQVTVYIRPRCVVCAQEKEFLSQKGMEFVAKNILEDHQAMQDLLNLGIKTTPVTLIDDEIIIGFDREKREKIERLLGISQG